MPGNASAPQMGPLLHGSRILVTGAAGFIGSRVSELLLSSGCEVVGVDNLNDAYDPRLKGWRLARLQQRSGFHFHQVDITDGAALRSIFFSPAKGLPGQGSNGGLTARVNGQSPFDAVINLAARAGVRQSEENPWVYIYTNVIGALNLLQLSHETGVRKYVLASTSSLYGGPALGASHHQAHPFCEDQSTDRPLSPYAASKKAAEALCYTYHHLKGLDITVLRYFTVYGPAGRPDMSIFRFIKAIAEDETLTIYGDGAQRRDFTYIEDIARGTVAALKPLGYEIINLGGDHPVVLNDVIGLIEERLERKSKAIHKPRHPADVLATWADISKAQRLLGWRPEVSFEEGIRNTIAWYLQNRELARDLKDPELQPSR